MHLSAQAYGQSPWPRHLCGKCPHWSRPQVLFLFSGIFLLICTVALAVYSMAQHLFSFAGTILTMSSVFLLILVVVSVNKALQKPEAEYTAPEDTWMYRIEQIEI